MDKLKYFLNSYFWLVILLVFVVLAVGTFYVAGIYREGQRGKIIHQSEIQANTAVVESINAAKNADNSSIERKTEDAVRQKTITPNLETARRNSQTSKTELEKLQNSNAKINLHNANSSLADNCRKLRDLFPNEKFEYCHD